ncbi:MAG: hypothetical protein Q8P59_09840, partial [Dehalococcoidia bacterium]|nr:hypothetical protein [Dehalococcoidia bacterium]
FTLVTNVPDPGKKVAKGKTPPSDPEKIEAKLVIKNGEETEEVTVVSDRISQEGLGAYTRLGDTVKDLQGTHGWLKSVLFKALQAGVPVREGTRGAEASSTSYDTCKYLEAYEASFKILQFLVSKFSSAFQEDATAQQMFEEAGLFVKGEEEGTLRMVSMEEFKAQFSSSQVRKDLKIKVVK